MVQQKYRFHDERPNFYTSITRLQKITRNNLSTISALFGIEFSNRAWIWKVRVHGRQKVKEKFLHDIRILGRWGKHRIEYWRHESGGKGSGQTYIYIDGKKWKEFSISWLKKWPNNILLSIAIQNKDRERLLYLSTHSNDFVRETIRLVIKMMELEYVS